MIWSTTRSTALFLLLGIGALAPVEAQAPAARTDAVAQPARGVPVRSGQERVATPAHDAALRKADALLERARFTGAAELLRPLAKAGVPGAMTRLGVLHHLGRGVKEDDSLAFGLFTGAAAAGEADAMFWLGRMYLLGHGPPRDDPDPDRAAAVWFFESARRGHAEAQYYLGMLFLAGTGVETNATEARKWFSRAAASGHQGARRFVEQQDASR